MKACPACGALVPAEKTVCASCGEAVARTPAVTPLDQLAPGPMTVGPVESPDLLPSEIPDPVRLQPSCEPATAQETAETTDERPSTRTSAVIAPPAPPVSEDPGIPPPPPMSNPLWQGNTTVQVSSQNAVWALVLGIASVMIPYSGIILGPIAITLAQRARQEEAPPWGLATAGLVLGIIGTVVWSLRILFYIAAFVGKFSHLRLP